jgi:hypothetical protein
VPNMNMITELKTGAIPVHSDCDLSYFYGDTYDLKRLIQPFLV